MHLTLDIDFDYDFKLIALSCFERGYRLAWLINKHLDASLERQEDLEANHGESCSLHEVFSGCYCDGEYTITLIRNRDANGVLLPELRQIDYLLKVENFDDDEESLVEMLREIQQVRGAFAIETSQLKDKEYLITE